MVEYLKAENRILRNKLPKRVDITPAERTRLVELGVRLGTAITQVITIVHPPDLCALGERERIGQEAPQARSAAEA